MGIDNEKNEIFRRCTLAALLMCLLSPAAAALDEPQADSSHAIVLVAERGTNETVLYTRNENERMSPASVTKS
jgi:D-alanyl-D-alanine carboxypeptidase